MKKYTVEYTVGAKLDIADIENYIASFLDNPVGAARIAMELLDTCDGLSVFPKRSPVRVKLDGKELRFTHKGKYTIIYYIHGDFVTIHSVIYSRRDILAILKD